MKPKLNIIARTNGVGLDRDVSIIREIASSAGYDVTVSHSRGISPLRRWLPQRKRFAANIFLERVFPRWLGAAEKNILIPNQERFPGRHLRHLASLDAIFCKSTHALEVFSAHHPNCRFTGFTSENLYDAVVPREEKTFLHLAGKSTLKGTEVILDLWKKHPEWPQLTLVQAKANAPEAVPSNVTLLSDYLSNEEIKRLYNAHPIHLCPSRSEGWGHYIVEAMHCGALVMTTDGPPMNELVTPERGILVATSGSEPRHLGTNYFVDPRSLEKTLQGVIDSGTDQWISQRSAAQRWADQNDQDFRDRLTEALATLLTPQSAPK